MMRFLLPVLGFSAIYSMFLLSVHPWDLVTGLSIAIAVILLFRRHLLVNTWQPLTGIGQRIVALLRFSWFVFVDTSKGIWTVSAIVLGLRPLKCSGIVAIPIGERTASGITVTAWATTLSPGSVLIDVDWEQRLMLFHYIDATEPDEIREKMQVFYDRYQRPIFP